MSKKLTELDEATAIGTDDQLYVVQGGVSKKVPASLVGSPPSAIAANGAVGLWRFNGDLTAEVGTNLTLNEGTEAYMVSNIPGSQALSFDDLTRVQHAAHDSTLNLTGALTVQFMIFPQSVHTDDGICVAFAEGGADTEARNANWQVNLLTNSRLRYAHEYGAGTNLVWDTTLDLPTGQWSHVALRREADGVTTTFTVNGTLSETTVLSNATTGGTDSILVLGGFPGVGAPTLRNRFGIFDLLVDNVHRTDADILRDANLGLEAAKRST